MFSFLISCRMFNKECDVIICDRILRFSYALSAPDGTSNPASEHRGRLLKGNHTDTFSRSAPHY